MIPNSVTVSMCTDALAALGARPLMALAPEEMGEIPAYADALVVNMGQPQKEKILSASIALRTAEKNNTPIVFDPVGAGASEFRKNEFRRLLEQPFKGIIKGNRGELYALTKDQVTKEGIDSLKEYEWDVPQDPGRVWVVTGKTDEIKNYQHSWSFPHDREGFLNITGTGCMTGAVMGACTAVCDDPMIAALAALCIMEKALANTKKAGNQYGSRKVLLIDALSNLEGEGLFSEHILLDL